MEISYDFPSKFDDQYSILTRKLMRLLSEDARMSILELSNNLRVSRRTVRERIARLEADLRLSYTIEFKESTLGLISPHLVLVKFRKKPDYDEITKILSSSYIPQLAATIKGRYDLLIYANAPTSDEYVRWDKGVQIKFSKYGVLWHSSDVAHKQLGYFPIRNELIDRLGITHEHREILKRLNSNSRMTFSEISKGIKIHFNTVAYNFNKIIQKDYIRRFTIAAALPKGLTPMSMFSKYTLEQGYENDAARIRKAYTTSGIDFPILNRYPVCTQLVGSYDFFNLGLFDSYETAYKHQILSYRENFKRHRARLEYGYIDKVLLGRLPLRSIDSKKEYNTIKWTEDS